MNATAVLAQKKRLRTPEMNIRVPDLTSFPEKYHNLFYKISRTSCVRCFSAVPLKKGFLLAISLREEEQPNIIVMQRIKALFKGINGANFLDTNDKGIISVEIPS